MDWFSLLLPFAYLAILITSLATFSYLYRTRKSSKARSLEPWFPPHLQRDIYLSLLELQASASSASASPSDSSTPPIKIPDSVLRAALLRRATEDIHRLISIRNARPALAQLLQRGAVGDELWQRFLLAEKEIELELRDVVGEANALAPQQNWGATIFNSAGECAHNEILRRKLKEVEGRRGRERARWEARRNTVREGFMRELDGGDAGKGVAKEAGKHAIKESAKEASSGTPTDASKDGRQAGSSDDDGVIVENGGPGIPAAELGTTPANNGGSTRGKNKKRKK